MNRRSFLKSLFGAAAVAAVPKTVYVFAPPSGWSTGDSGLCIMESTAHGMSAYMEKFVIPCISDNFFRESPLLRRIRDEHPAVFESRGMILPIASPANLSA